MDQQHILVYEVAPHQRLDQLSAAEYHDVLAWLLLERSHRLRGVAFEERGVAPWERFPQCRGRHVLLRVVEYLSVRVVGSTGPDGVEVLIGPPPEQQRPSLCHPLAHHA